MIIVGRLHTQPEYARKKSTHNPSPWVSLGQPVRTTLFAKAISLVQQKCQWWVHQLSHHHQQRWSLKRHGTFCKCKFKSVQMIYPVSPEIRIGFQLGLGKGHFHPGVRSSMCHLWGHCRRSPPPWRLRLAGGLVGWSMASQWGYTRNRLLHFHGDVHPGHLT